MPPCRCPPRATRGEHRSDGHSQAGLITPPGTSGTSPLELGSEIIRRVRGISRHMHGMPSSVQPALRRLERRLAIGLFLAVWPAWAAGSLLAAGLVVVACRLFLPGAAPALPWL